jgi:hypothetical protein
MAAWGMVKETLGFEIPHVLIKYGNIVWRTNFRNCYWEAWELDDRFFGRRVPLRLSWIYESKI